VKIGTVLSYRRSPNLPVGSLVMEEAVSRGWIRPFARGQYLYGPQWTNLVRRIQETLVARACELGFEEWIFPRLLPSSALDSFELTQYTPDLLLEAGTGASSFLDPVQCVSLYYTLRGQRLSAAELPIRIVETLGGWTWRNEDHDRLDGPYRAVEFNRVEHVYIGHPTDVQTIRETVRHSLCGLLTELGLSWQVVVGAGCMEIPSIEQAREAAAYPQDVPVQDIEVPVRGALRPDPQRPANFGEEEHHSLQPDGTLTLEPNDDFYVDTDEIAGCSVEGSHLPDQFDIASEDGSPLWSGCCGIGLNRVVVALLYQHGFDQNRWPATLSLS
jgi:seryl-tRNA synthetase